MRTNENCEVLVETLMNIFRDYIFHKPKIN